MAAETAISWADSTCNFWIGCTKISPACDHCYAETLNKNRLRRTEWGPHGQRVRIAQGFKDARKFQRAANDNGGVDPALGRRRRVFVNSLSDFFDNHRSIVWRDEAWQLIRECPDVIFMLLTKRPENIRKMLPADWGDGYPNVWIGTTVEDQKRADHRVPHLLAVPGSRIKRFLSCEPLLDTVNPWHHMIAARAARLTGGSTEELPGLDWIIVGGESGREARITDPRWVRALRDMSAAAQVAFHLKQNGEWVAGTGDRGMWVYPVNGDTESYCWSERDSVDLGRGWIAKRVGIRKSGNSLDGAKHLEFPEDERIAA